MKQNMWGAFAAAIVMALAACVGDEPGSASGSDGGSSEGGTGDGSVTDGASGDACTTCGGSGCVDLSGDKANCGACGHACSGSFTCSGGHCGNEVADVASGSYFSCVLLHDGSVWCWGDNQYGELGHDPATDPTCDWNNGSAQTTHCNATPSKVGGLSGPVAQISAGHAFACAVLQSDGSAWCWGLNDRNQIASTGGATSFAPVRVGSLTDVVQVVAGSFMACAVTKSGTVYCWGRDLGGSFGNGESAGGVNTADETSAVPVLASISDVAEVAVQEGVCARTNAGTVSCWGVNGFGNLGHDPGAGSPADVACNTALGYAAAVCNSTPQAVAGITNVAHVFANGGAYCALKSDQTVRCWGYDGEGNYSDGTVRNSTPGSGGSNGNVNLATLPQTSLAAGLDSHACAIATDGHIWCWGRGDDGELGLGSTTDAGTACIFGDPCATPAQQITAPADFVAHKGVKISGAGWRFDPIATGNSMALLDDGTVWAWGDNRFGQLGHFPAGGDGGSGDTTCAGQSCGDVPVRVANLP